MIEAKNLVPEVYFDKSRDFQFLAHLYEVVFNYLKTNIDSLYDLPFSRNSNKQLIDLVAYTLGFKPRHKYNTEQLVNICYILSFLLKNKGNKQSLEWTVKNLYRMEGLVLEPDTQIVVENIGNVEVVSGSSIEVKIISLYIGGLENVSLLQDILDYILPAGTLYKIIKSTLKSGLNFPETLPSKSRTISTVRVNNVGITANSPDNPAMIGANDNIWVAKAEPLNTTADEVIDKTEE